MTYELALELKNAGFPQEPKVGDLVWHEGKIYIHSGGGHLDQSRKHEGLYIEKGATCCFDDPDLPNPFKNIYTDVLVLLPTLEELIEACRPCILRVSSDGSNKASFGSITGIGSTPTEAVARLWLALNPAQ